MPQESGMRKLARALANKAEELSSGISTAPDENSRRYVVYVYNALGVVLDYLNEELKTEPVINGRSGPIPKTWSKKS